LRPAITSAAIPLPLLERHAGQRVDHGPQPLLPGAARRPRHGQRVQAEHAEHRPDLGEMLGCPGGVAGRQRGVAVGDRLVHDGERLRDAEVVVKRGGERRRQ
jgi:hypothetical protein